MNKINFIFSQKEKHFPPLSEKSLSLKNSCSSFIVANDKKLEKYFLKKSFLPLAKSLYNKSKIQEIAIQVFWLNPTKILQIVTISFI